MNIKSKKNVCSLNWQRARSDDQIEQRIDTILAAAADLFAEHRFDQITFAMIGKNAKFTRSNLYRYFTTKEEVFLALLTRDLQQWILSAEARLSERERESQEFIKVWLELILASPRMLKLFSILYTLLEHNVSDEKLLQFKQTMVIDLEKLTAVLVSHNNFSSAEQASKFVIAQTSLISGMYSLLEMSDKQRDVMQKVNLPVEKSHYLSVLEDSVLSLYRAFSASNH